MDGSPRLRLYGLRLLTLATAMLMVATVMTAWQKSALPGFPSLLWPATAIGLAGMWLWGRSVWPAAFAPLAASALLSGAPWIFALLAPASVTISLLLACRLLEARDFNASFTSTKDTTIFLTRGALFPMLLAGLGIAASMAVAGMAPWEALPTLALTYGVANVTGCVLLSPAIFLAAKRRPLNLPTGAVVPLVFLVFSVWASFSGLLPASPKLLSYIPFPFLIWAAWKGGLPAAVGGAIFTVATAIGTLPGGGPFAGASGLAMFVEIETYVAVMATTALLAGSAAETMRRENALRVEAALRLAESERLKAHLQPHFLFNCLTAIHSLAATSPESARAGIVSLADLLRASLDNSERKRVSLREEMRFVESYLNLQKLRFEDTLGVTVRWSEAHAQSKVLPMIVQPMVENAIKHGIPKDGTLQIEVSVFPTEDSLHLRVGNNAAEDCAPSSWVEGTGLRNLRDRLNAAYGNKAKLALSGPRAGWIEAEISISKSALNEGPCSR